ncbi:MAG: hypothetical protein AABY32_01390 [Nanoarchaeota archaeon]
MSNEAKVCSLPKCDFCRENNVDTDAIYDGKTTMGCWGNMCEKHFKQYGVGLGLGKGQKLVVKTPSTNKNTDKVVNAIDNTDPSDEDSMMELLMDSVREVECPLCHESRSVEPDANYTFICEGCGAKVKVNSIF